MLNNNYYYNEFFEIGQLKFHFDLYQIGLKADDPVYTLIKVLEELDYSSLLARYSKKGRKGYNPIMMFSVILYANMRGIRAVDRIVELCERDLGFIWLTKGKKPKRDAFYDFINKKLTEEVLEDLHYQFIRRLSKEGLVNLQALFVDGTKFEACANRYTFVWRGSVNYHLAGLLDKIEGLYEIYNKLISAEGYDHKYKLAKAQMFVIEGMDVVRRIIETNRERKISKKKKLSNNKVIEIDSFSPIDLLRLQTSLVRIARGENIVFKVGKGNRKPLIQKLYEELEECGQRLLRYKDHFEIMGSDRNSYSKTDIEATFMRMKDDHMRNGQLKPAYNVQIAVENYFIIHSYVSNDRTDYNTLIPVLEKHNTHLGFYPGELTADSGYSSEKNLVFLEEKRIKSFIKLQLHEKMKTRSYRNDIGKHYNMELVKDGGSSYYICHDGRELRHQRTEVSHRSGYRRVFQVYGCQDCDGCQYKKDCLYRYDETKDLDKNKVMKVNENWERLKAISHKNILSEEGIINRQIRSIQTEGHFGDIKENNKFRRFNYRSRKKVSKEFLIHVLARNLSKYHRFIHGEIERFEGKMTEKIA